MCADIFVPESSPADAIVSPLHTITLVTADKKGTEAMMTKGLDLHSSGWQTPPVEMLESSQSYFGFEESDRWQYALFSGQGSIANIQILVLLVDAIKAQLRPTADGRYFGGATIGFPMRDMSQRVEKMASAGVHSTVGIKELEFSSPTGETYVSREVHFLGTENIFMLGVQRPDAFVQIGAIDDRTDIGAAAYSARCVENLDAVNNFVEQVLGFELRRDIEMTIGPRSGLLMEEGIPERFVQAFAPGAGTAYLVFLEHGGHGIPSPCDSYGPPNRGLVRWSFATADLDAVQQSIADFGAEIVHAAKARSLPHLAPTRSLVTRDPSGFEIEIFEQ